MAVNWGAGLGQLLGLGLGAALGPYARKRQQQTELEMLRDKALGVAEMITPNWQGLNPKEQADILNPIVKQMVMPKPSFGQELGGVFGQLFGLGQQQQEQPNMPIPPQPVQAPSAEVNIPGAGGSKTSPNFKIGDKVRLKSGEIFTIEDDADIAAARDAGAVIYK